MSHIGARFLRTTQIDDLFLNDHAEPTQLLEYTRKFKYHQRQVILSCVLD